jgi:hypothetical protein
MTFTFHVPPDLTKAACLREFVPGLQGKGFLTSVHRYVVSMLVRTGSNTLGVLKLRSRVKVEASEKVTVDRV